ncbi:MAG: ATP-dependent DNA helicase RecG [Clostridia bacterium]|nr:ATP-dependent DNA helicase RecG [Clostridia bacterium]
MKTDFGKTNIRYLHGVGEKRAELFNKFGISSVSALLDFYPRTYEDWSNCFTISDAPLNEPCCVKARAICAPTAHKAKSGITLFRFVVSDGRTTMNILIFNNKYAAAKIKVGEEYLFFGRVSGNLYQREMLSPAIEKALSGDKIRPIYRQSEGLTTKVVEKCVASAMERVQEVKEEILPDWMIKQYALCDVYEAYRNIHQPISKQGLDKARHRLAFEELLKLQLGISLLSRRKRVRCERSVYKSYLDEFVSLLPFEMTGAQVRAVNESLGDMMDEHPMSRLVQGDVGSGKTCVAFALVHTAVKNGLQCAMMAPTEILARQHFESAKKILGNSGVRTALLLGSTGAKQKRQIKEMLKNGEIDFVIGTHALVQGDVEFKRLGFVVTDEQHRFGVAQRAALASKGENTHMLVMSATPIPRTLALIIYGDLDISILNERPAGRMPIKTYHIDSTKREKAYDYIKKHLDRGRQAYIVCPMVEEGESDLASATEFFERLQKDSFKNYKLGLIHGKMKASQKAQVMEEFGSGEINLLVATTVIEVGIDVPNAVVMVIENAERFGLSQLHQLRGRIGRGSHKCSCILISDAQNNTAMDRLAVMCQTDDGFKIADEDLRQRGPGDFFGNKQHGIPELKIANMLTDMEILMQTQAAAKQIMSGEKESGTPLSRAVAEMFRNIGDNGFN